MNTRQTSWPSSVTTEPVTPCLSELLQQASCQLETVSASPLLDAQLLLAHALQKAHSYLLTWPESTPSQAEQALFEEYLQQRRKGIPVAYILGYKEFWSLPFTVTPDVLIPRPETELLVEQVLESCQTLTQPRILELGTGSGAIAIALATELPRVQITASDYSEAALATARNNAQNILSQQQEANITFLHSDWLTKIPRTEYDIIVSNPPYIAEADSHLEGDIRHEPLSALVSGSDGLDAIRMIIRDAKHYLCHGGLLLLEHGFDQGQRVKTCMQAAGYAHCKTLQDPAQTDRLTMGRYLNS